MQCGAWDRQVTAKESMSQQNQQSFTLRIASSDTSHSGGGTASCRATVDGSSTAQTVDLAAAYRISRMASHNSVSSMRGISGSCRSGGTSFYRRAA